MAQMGEKRSSGDVGRKRKDERNDRPHFYAIHFLSVTETDQREGWNIDMYTWGKKDRRWAQQQYIYYTMSLDMQVGN